VTSALDREATELFDRTVRGVLAGDGDRIEALVAAGWRDLLDADPAAAVSLVFTAQGELRARTSALDDVALVAAAAPAPVLDTVSYVHPLGPSPVTASGRDSVFAVDGLSFAPRRGEQVAMCAFADGAAVLVTAPGDLLPLAPVGGLDPTLALVRVRGDVPVDACEVLGPVSPDEVAAACRRALAHELVGLADVMLARAAEYAGAREQFGQPIGAFQAVKHRLADVLVAVRGARVATEESWPVPGTRGEGGDASPADVTIAAAAAKCLAGRAARLASDNCLQVTGAIGFTEEHDLHHSIARATVLDLLYGSARQLRAELGTALLERGRMPRPGAL
jgi:hypothetical protein